MKNYLIISLTVITMLSCGDSELSKLNAEKQMSETAITYPKEQVDFEDGYNLLDIEVKKAENDGNNYLYQEAIDKRSKYLETQAMRVNNWVGIVESVGEGLTSNCIIDCKCYKDSHYELHFENVPMEKIRMLKKGTKIMFSGKRSERWSYITEGTFTVIN